MARDYAKRPHKKRKSGNTSKKGPAGAAWLLMGVVIGLLLAVVGYFKMGHMKAPEVLTAVLAEPPAGTQQKHPAHMAQAKPKFEFYSLLPQMEVEVGNPDPVQQTKVSTSTKTSNDTAKTALEKAKFRLQLASFRQFSDADSLKARLTLAGFKLEIAAITLPSGEIWYRVRTPVLSDRSAAVNLQKKLQKQSVASVVVKADEG